MKLLYKNAEGLLCTGAMVGDVLRCIVLWLRIFLKFVPLCVIFARGDGTFRSQVGVSIFF